MHLFRLLQSIKCYGIARLGVTVMNNNKYNCMSSNTCLLCTSEHDLDNDRKKKYGQNADVRELNKHAKITIRQLHSIFEPIDRMRWWGFCSRIRFVRISIYIFEYMAPQFIAKKSPFEFSELIDSISLLCWLSIMFAYVLVRLHSARLTQTNHMFQ